jgi:hypothetical protein
MACSNQWILGYASVSQAGREWAVTQNVPDMEKSSMVFANVFTMKVGKVIFVTFPDVLVCGSWTAVVAVDATLPPISAHVMPAMKG